MEVPGPDLGNLQDFYGRLFGEALTSKTAISDDHGFHAFLRAHCGNKTGIRSRK